MSITRGDVVGRDKIIGYTAEQVSALLTQISATFQPQPFDGRCPYVGPDAFEEEDAARFFGRETLVAELVARVKAARFIVNLHIYAAGPRDWPIEYPYEPPGWLTEFRDSLLTEPIIVAAEGTVAVSDAPGLGIVLTWRAPKRAGFFSLRSLRFLAHSASTSLNRTLIRQHLPHTPRTINPSQ